jgi:signal transduction histidine kinase
MPLDFAKDYRAGSSLHGKEECSVISTAVQDCIAGIQAAQSRHHDSPNSAVGVALAKFAHEFANELNTVSGAVQFLEKEIEQPNQARNTLRHVKSGIGRLGSLLNELRALAQAQRLKFQSTQLASVIKELLETEMPRYAASGIRVEINLPRNLPPVMLDSSKFRQAVLNLCRNAVDAMPHGGSLTLRGYRTDSNVQLEVVDTGVGIPPDMDAFALFTTTKSTGMGVGLPIVREIISAHGGTVGYISKPGNGTTFRITLPVSE